jgi:hypothetical protein
MITWEKHSTMSSRIIGMIDRFVDTSGWAELADRTLTSWPFDSSVDPTETRNSNF